ncbi:TatD related DNase [Zea mays]|uniref:TatD related DNase n=1 Tax=Zea mays TaxID=4577 RepID=A0A1D6ERQ8_MAIZE|nr:TatD related DNase [Zea mays]
MLSCALGLISRLNIGALELEDYLALGAIFSATDSVCTLQVLSQYETPFLYNLVFGEGVVNDATLLCCSMQSRTLILEISAVPNY